MSDARLLPSFFPRFVLVSSFLPSVSSSSYSSCQLLTAVVLAGPHLPVLDRSGPRRTPTGSARSQWASPDLNRRVSERCGPRRTPTGSARSQWASPDLNRRVSERCGPRRTPTGSARSQWASPDLNRRVSERCGPRRTPTGSARSQWASPDLNRRVSERCGPRRTSTGEILRAVGLAGPQPDLTRTSTARSKVI